VSPSLSSLAKAASAALGIEIHVDGRRAWHYAAETGRCYWLTRADLAYAADCVTEHGSDAYSHWCAGTGREMSRRAQEVRS
jgi:hypothetical protein